MQRILSIALLQMMLLNIGCAVRQSQESVDTLPTDFTALPAVAARFETMASKKGEHTHLLSTEWHMLREPQRLETREFSGNTGEGWIRSTDDLLFHQRFFHDDRHVIEYSPVDLGMLGDERNWKGIALLLDPALLHRLERDGSEKILGRVAQRYKGYVDGVKYEILWLPVEKIPAAIHEITGKGSTVTLLKELYPLAESPWPFTDTGNYRLIEYSDIGDMERDPFVAKMLGQIPGTSHHAH